MPKLQFWNGNKSADRQTYELALLRRVLQSSQTQYSDASILEDCSDYPRAADEGAVFSNGTDVCVTVAGNPKFSEGDYLPVFYPLMNGLLGHRLLVIREGDDAAFAAISSATQLQQKVLGIPATWADADLFRANGYAVSEKGMLNDLYLRLKAGECDYVALGVNEIYGLFAEFANPLGGLLVEPTLRLYYPYALVFYVHPDKPELADALSSGLHQLAVSGELQDMMTRQFHPQLDQAQLTRRTEIALQNPALPENMLPVLEACKADFL